MDNLAAMRLFARVADTGSFSKAAAALGLAPSSVSRQVSALERELGVTLLARTTRTLRLTEAGEAYHREVSAILRAIDEANAAVADHGREPRGVLRVTTPVILARLLVVPLLAQFMARHPGLQVEMHGSDDVIDLVHSGIDVAVRVGELRDSSLIARRLVAHKRVLCASPAYLAQRGRPRRPADLAQHELLAFRRTAAPSVWTLQQGTAVERVSARARFWSNDIDAVAAAARSGLGIALLPDWMAGADLASGAVVQVLPQWNPAPEGHSRSALQAVYPRTRHVPRKVRLFVDFLAEHLQQLMRRTPPRSTPG